MVFDELCLARGAPNSIIIKFPQIQKHHLIHIYIYIFYSSNNMIL